MGKVAKVPVIMQLEALECGAACLAMIAAYFKKWIPLTQVRSDCGVSRDGSVAKNILNAGRAYGFEAAGYRLEPADLQTDEFDKPLILHWDFNHFVVLCGYNKRKKVYVINDPGRGKLEVSLEEFDKSFTGIALVFKPTEKFKREGKPKNVWEFTKKSLRGAMFPFVLTVILSLATTVLALFSKVFNRVFIDNILSGTSPEWLTPFMIIMFVVLAVQVLIGIIQSVYWLKIEGKFSISSASQFMWHILRLPLEFFSQRNVGDIVARQNSTGEIALTLVTKIAPLFINVISMVFYFSIMVNWSWQLTVIGLVATFVNMFLTQYVTKRLFEYQKAAIPSAGKLASATYSAFEMIETIKSTGAESGFFERWAGFYARQINAGVKIAKFTQHIGAIPSLIDNFAGLVLQLSGIYLIMRGNFTIGMLTTFQGFLSGFLGPVGSIIDVYKSFVTMRLNVERVEDVLNYPLDVKEIPAVASKEEETKLTGMLELKNITFGYSKLANPLIKDFSLTLKPGSWVALVGGSGSGKSTIAKLIMGLFKPWEGEILFDSQKKEDIDKYKFHSSIAMVDQDKVMFSDTIKNNIKMWDESIEDFAMILAARDADIHKSIITRPDGYNHVMREGGRDFSGGQCQRIEIARALSQEPTIVIFDEATSALDAKTEEIVMQNIRKLGCTCIVVAHRLSTIRDCDEIIVLDRGSVVERGTHSNLMKQDGLYTQLVTTE